MGILLWCCTQIHKWLFLEGFLRAEFDTLFLNFHSVRVDLSSMQNFISSCLFTQKILLLSEAELPDIDTSNHTISKDHFRSRHYPSRQESL